jgi:hypothetical protein
VIVSRRIAGSVRIVTEFRIRRTSVICSGADCSEVATAAGQQAGNRPFPFRPGRFLDGKFARISSWHWDNYVGF